MLLFATWTKVAHGYVGGSEPGTLLAIEFVMRSRCGGPARGSDGGVFVGKV